MGLLVNYKFWRRKNKLLCCWFGWWLCYATWRPCCCFIVDIVQFVDVGHLFFVCFVCFISFIFIFFQFIATILPHFFFFVCHHTTGKMSEGQDREWEKERGGKVRRYIIIIIIKESAFGSFQKRMRFGLSKVYLYDACVSCPKLGQVDLLFLSLHQRSFLECVSSFI